MATETATLEDLYKLADTFTDAGEKASELTNEYQKILTTAINGGPTEKRLSSQLLSKYFKYFLQQSDSVLDVMVALCEIDDPLLQSQVAKDLYTLAESMSAHAPSPTVANDFIQRIAFFLAQLTEVDNQSELAVIFRSLEKMFKVDMKNTLDGLLMVLSEEEIAAIVVERSLKYISKYLKTHADENMLDKEMEEKILNECKKKLEMCKSKDEMSAIVSLLGCLSSMKTLTGRQDLVNKIAEHSISTDTVQTKDSESVERVLSCCKMAVPYLSKNVQSTKFVTYYCDHLLPLVHERCVGAVEGEGEEETKDEIIRTFAEISTFTGDLDEAETRISNVLTVLKDYMPLPDVSEDVKEVEATLVFSAIENLLYALFNLCKKHPMFLGSDEQADRLADLRQRLQYVARRLAELIKPIKEVLSSAKASELQGEKFRAHVLTSRLQQNITTIIRDLFHNPPQYKATVVLSHQQDNELPDHQQPSNMKRALSSNGAEAGGKRTAAKGARSLYSPPGGKFSEKAGPLPNFPGERGMRGGGGGRRGWRGYRGRQY